MWRRLEDCLVLREYLCEILMFEKWREEEMEKKEIEDISRVLMIYDLEIV